MIFTLIFKNFLKNQVDMIDDYDQSDEIESFFNNNAHSDVNLDTDSDGETDFDDY